MTVHQLLLAEDLAGIYERGDDDPEFDQVLQCVTVSGDAELADLIEADGRLRLRLARAVSVGRYLKAVPDLAERPDSLDAAIDMALRALARTGRADEESVRRLMEDYPEFSSTIRDAAALNNALWSTRHVRRKLKSSATRDLPCDFGPQLEDGLHRYELRELLGEGAFGQVYLAVARKLSEQDHPAFVSIKLLPGGDRPGRVRQQLIDEATKARRINHPNVALVLDRGVSGDNEDFLVYEYVDGGDLARWARRHAEGVGVKQAVLMVAKIARGVHAAHMAGLVHCDLKPNNIVLTASGEPKVADFGVAIRCDDPSSPRQAGRMETAPVGNLAFMSPEQFRMEAGALTIPTDVYALGGILYWLLTAVLPNGSTPEAIRQAHDPVAGRGTPPALRSHRRDVDRDLESICGRSLAARPQDRFSSAQEVAENLEAWLGRHPIPWTKPSVFRRARLWASRKPAVAVATVLILIMVVVGGPAVQHLRIEAAVAEAELQKEEEYRQKFRARLRGFLRRFRASVEKGIAHEVLPQVWVAEWLFNDKVFGQGTEQLELWELRKEAIRDLMANARLTGGEWAFAAMLWETALAFWLVNDGEYGEAQPLIAGNHAKWAAVLDSEDPWLLYIRALGACCVVGPLAGCDLDSTSVATVRSDLDSIAAVLEAAEISLHQEEWGSPLHVVVLSHLLMLYEPDLLDLPDRLAVVQRTYLDVLE